MKYSTKIRINEGEQVDLEELPKEQGYQIIREAVTKAMESIGFRRKKRKAA